MPDTIALILFLLPLAYSPGPGNMVFAAKAGAALRLAATFPGQPGYHLGHLGGDGRLGWV